MSLLGEVRLVRHYYHCRHCGAGFCPWDTVLRLTAAALSPAADEVICLAGVQASFAEASTRSLPKLAGLRVSESTVERATEAAGQRVGQAVAEGRGADNAKPWAWHRDAEGKTCAYVGSDGTGVGQQGPGGVKVEGRMAQVGVIYNPVPEERSRWANPRGRRPTCQARYLAGLDGLEALGIPLRRQAAAVGMEQAERWIALSDGGSGLEDFFRVNFGRVDVIILDFYHAAEYLGKLAKAWHPQDADAAEALRAAWCHRLKHEGGPVLLEELRGLDRRGHNGARACYDEVLTYFTNQVHRMDYPRYLAKGWQIGSGPVESACKTVVGQRLKGAGMRWGEDGADAVCHLRALFRSEPSQWEAFWHQN